MKRLTSLLPLLAASLLHAQNLVPNPSFETNTACPFFVSQLSFATPWINPTNGTPDYFHTCADPLTSMNVPNNQFGQQDALDGNAYAGFYAVYNGPQPLPMVDTYREYIKVELTEPLQAGTTYRVEYDLSLSDFSRLQCNRISACFTTNSVFQQEGWILDDYDPQARGADALPVSDKAGWTHVTDCFTATENFRYLMIGCFDPVEEMVIQAINANTGMHFAYYYIDQVSVVAVPGPNLGPDIDTCELADGIVLSGHPDSDLYSWSIGESGQTITVFESGMYWLYQRYEQCWFVDSIDVTVLKGPAIHLGPDTTLSFCEGEKLTFGVAPTEGWSYHWSDGFSGPLRIATEPGTYALTVTTDEGCISYEERTFYDDCADRLYIPNAFTPDGDGTNDIFFIPHDGLHQLHIRIFDRWGEMVFESEDPGFVWTGGFGETFVADGSYHYLLHYQQTEGKWREERGWVTVLR